MGAATFLVQRPHEQYGLKPAPLPERVRLVVGIFFARKIVHLFEVDDLLAGVHMHVHAQNFVRPRRDGLADEHLGLRVAFSLGTQRPGHGGKIVNSLTTFHT